MSFIPETSHRHAPPSTPRATGDSLRLLRYLAPLLVCLLLCLGGVVWAQYTITSSSLAGGGGTSTGGAYSISGTIGNTADSNPMTGGIYSATGGFLSIRLAQSPGAPRLTIRLDGDSAVISWPSPSSGWQIRQSPDLKITPWTIPQEPVADNGAVKSIQVAAQGARRFFRLVRP